jgi:hypothetical protein
VEVSDLTGFELGVAILSQILVFTTLIGLFVRRHVTTCKAFGLYLLVVLAADTAMLMDALFLKSGIFYTRLFWVSKEVLLNGLTITLMLELASRVFGRFPGARATARVLMYVVLVLTLASVAWASGALSLGFESLAGELQPRIVTGTTWVFAAIAAVVVWYRLPIETMPKAILMGVVPYLIFNYLILALWTANRWPAHGWMASLDTWAWTLLLVYWARSAWQPFREIMPGRSPVPAVQGSAG